MMQTVPPGPAAPVAPQPASVPQPAAVQPMAAPSVTQPSLVASSTSAVATSLLSSSTVRWGLGIVAVIVLIYIVASMRSIMNGPVGQAIGGIIGTAGSLLAAAAGLPPWLLIGLGAAYLLGPAILKMGGAVARQFSSAIREGNASAEALKATESPEYVKSYSEAIATEVLKIVRTNQANEQGASEAAQERAQAAQEARATVKAEAAADPNPDVERGDSDGEARANEIIVEE